MSRRRPRARSLEATAKRRDPLHLDPLQPVAATDGSLANPIGSSAVELDAGRPMAYEDLAPSTTYTDGRFEYLTDEHAMPARVRGVLAIQPAHTTVRHRAVQADIGHLANLPGRWQGGHIVAISLGGFASGPNLFPQSGNFNQSAYARLEHGWRDALRGGVAVGVDIALSEGPHPRVPEFIIVSYWEDNDGDTLPLLNEPRVQ